MVTQELLDFANKKSSKVFAMIKAKSSQFDHYILVCESRYCGFGGGTDLLDSFEKEITNLGLSSSVKVIASPCFGLCEQTPNIFVSPGIDNPEGQLYSNIGEQDIRTILTQHIGQGKTVTEKLTIVDE